MPRIHYKTLFLRLLRDTLLMAFPLALCAMTPGETEEMMNVIKLDETMIYGEEFDDSKDIAYGKAMAELMVYANELRDAKGIDMLQISDLQPLVKELYYSSGGRHTVLVYIPLERMYAIRHASHRDVVANGDDGHSAHADIAAQRAESPPPVNPVPGSPARPTELPTPRPAVQPAADDIIAALCGQDNWTEIKGLLTAYKNMEQIRETGYCTSAAEVPADAVAILIDDMYGILSILSPSSSPQRINYRTGRPDSESNYSNCKVIVWYR